MRYCVETPRLSFSTKAYSPFQMPPFLERFSEPDIGALEAKVC